MKMAERPSYIVIDVDISTTFSNKLVDGSSTYADNKISAVYLTPRDASHSMCPAGSMFSISFGDCAPLMLTEVTPGYDFECGMLGGLKMTNGVALAGAFVRLIVVFDSGMERAGS